MNDLKMQFILRMIVVSVVVSLTVLPFPNVTAQERIQWSPQQRIPGYKQDTQQPFLVADQNRTVHAFASQLSNDGARTDIIYSTWTLENGWSEPLDIILAPYKNQARMMGAALTLNGLIHLAYFGGDELGAGIYYSQAPAMRAHNAKSWSGSKEIGPKAVTPSVAATAVDHSGNLIVLYSGNDEGNGLYEVYSTDSGQTWSDKRPIYFTYEPTKFPLSLQLYADSKDTVHAVWSLVGESGNSESVYYTHVSKIGDEWIEPLLIERAIDFEADTPSIIEYNDILMMIYHNQRPTSRWWRVSRDNGYTWTAPVRAFPDHIGSNGAMSMVIDSNNVLYGFYGNRTGDANHGMWYSIWRETQWTYPRPVVDGDLFRDEPDGNGFDPSFANAIVSQGNVILVTWRTDPAAGPNGAWYSYAVVDAPELPIVPLADIPIPEPTVTPSIITPRATSVQVATATSRPNVPDFTDDSPQAWMDNPAMPIVIGIIPMALIVAAILAVNEFGRRR